MGFNLQLFLRVLLLTLNSVVLAFSVQATGLFLTSACLAALLVFQAWALVQYLQRTNRELARFLDAIAYDDFSQNFSDKEPNASFRELGNALNKVIQRFQKIRQEKENTTQFLRLVLKQIPVAVLVVDDAGRTVMCNAQTKRLLGIKHLNHLRDLEALDNTLFQALSSRLQESRKVVKVTLGGFPEQLAITWTDFTTSSGRQTIITLQNIRMELENQEMHAWQNLIRILSHEVMNSLTPIASLSHSTKALLQPIIPGQDKANQDSLNDIEQALETIARRSEGLMSFIDSYRGLARLPTPKPEYVSVESLFQRTLILMQPELEARNISCTTNVTPSNTSVFADQELLSQALINLLKNAADALAGQTNPQIKLTAGQSQHGRTFLEISDNGPGINSADLDQVWIPFFSTKRGGTGIGLSLTRQIVNLHGGSIRMLSEPGTGTRVIIALP